MKIGGIISIILGALSVIAGFSGITSNYADRAIRSIGVGIGFIVLGAYLISRAKAKREENQKKEKWKNE